MMMGLDDSHQTQPTPTQPNPPITKKQHKVRASGANVLLIQKSILRDAVTDLSLHYLVSV